MGRLTLYMGGTFQWHLRKKKEVFEQTFLFACFPLLLLASSTASWLAHIDACFFMDDNMSLDEYNIWF